MAKKFTVIGGSPEPNAVAMPRGLASSNAGRWSRASVRSLGASHQTMLGRFPLRGAREGRRVPPVPVAVDKAPPTRGPSVFCSLDLSYCRGALKGRVTSWTCYS